MHYSERFSDLETRQIYTEVVMSCMSCMSCHGSGEAAVLAELLSRDPVELPRRKPVTRRFSWRGLLGLPLPRLPSLT